jgi:hypothetical protein
MLEASATATTRTLTLTARDQCGSGGGNDTGHFRIDAITGLDVIGIH